jgi:acetolactate synthase I/II/III large subunit
MAQPPTNVAQLLLWYLDLEDGDHPDEPTTIFGVPGGAIKTLLLSLHEQRDRFRYVVCRHETAAAYMADAYARTSGRLGVVLVTSGPGATNALTGAINAQASGSSVLVVSGEPPEGSFGRGSLQEGVAGPLDVQAVFSAGCRYSITVTNPKNAPTFFAQALRVARSTPGQTAHISLPDDVALDQGLEAGIPGSPTDYRPVRFHGAETAAVHKTLDALLAAKRPLLFVGNGARSALADGERLLRFTGFVERFAIPVVTTPGAKGIFPETHPLSLRTYGAAGSPWADAYLELKRPAYDTLVVLGSALGEFASRTRRATTTKDGRWDPKLRPASPSAHFIQVDADPSVIGRSFLITEGVVADLASFIDQLAGAAENVVGEPAEVEKRRAAIAKLKKKFPRYERIDPPFPDWPPQGPVHPVRLMQALNEALRPVGEAHVFVDSGNCVGWGIGYLEIAPPTRLHSALSMGPMGFAVAGVVGAKVARPDSTCVAIVGDSSFLMHGTELSTAAAQDPPVAAVWIVLSEGDNAMVTQGMAYAYQKPVEHFEGMYSIGAPDLCAFAAALGARPYAVTHEDQLETTLAQAFKAAGEGTGPQVVVVSIDGGPRPPYYPAQTRPPTKGIAAPGGEEPAGHHFTPATWW